MTQFQPDRVRRIKILEERLVQAKAAWDERDAQQVTVTRNEFIANFLVEAEEHDILSATSPMVETDEWRLGCYMEWRAKRRTVKCTRCTNGKVGGGFKSIDGPTICPDCNGSSVKLVGPDSPAPEIPPILQEALRRTWWDVTHRVPTLTTSDTPPAGIHPLTRQMCTCTCHSTSGIKHASPCCTPAT